MNLRNAMGSASRRTSPDRAPTSSEDPAVSRPPKRAGSFGKGLGTALANSMTRATEGFANATKKSTTGPLSSPSLASPSPAALDASKEFPFGTSVSTPGHSSAQAAAAAAGLTAAAAAHATPDPSHLQNFGLRLSELVNQALAPTVGSHQSSSGGVASSVAKHAAGRSNIPSIDQIAYEGKKLPSRAKIQELAQTVVAELRYAKSIDAYFLRAASRAAFKALTLFASRMDALLVPVAKDPSSLVMPTTLKEGIHISPALEYNLGVATLTWIVEDALERCIEGDDDDPANYEGMPGFVSEILTPVRKRMETTILHVIQPVLTGVKTSLSASLMKGVRHPFISGGSPALTPSISNDPSLPPMSPAAGTTSAFNSPKAADGHLNSSTGANIWLKELSGRLEGSRKLLLPRIEARTSQDGEGWYISVAIHLIWKGLFVSTARPIEGKAHTTGSGKSGFWLSNSQQQALGEAGKRNPSPVQLSAALKSVASVGSAKVARGDTAASNTTSGRVTPSGVGAAGGDAISGRGPETSAATPPVGPTTSSSVPPPKAALAAASKASLSQVADLQAFQKMALRFCKGFVSDKALAAVAAELSRADAAEEEVEGDQQLQEEDEEDELARQALAEALEALNSTITVIQAIDVNFAGVRTALERGCGHSPASDAKVATSEAQDSPKTAGASMAAPQRAFNSRCALGGSSGVKSLEPLQLRALRAIPPLLLLHLVYGRLPIAVKLPSRFSNDFLSPPPALFGMSWQEYERSIAGFMGGSSWAQAAVQRWDKEVQQLWTSLSTKHESITFRRDAKLRDLEANHDGLLSSPHVPADEDTLNGNTTLGADDVNDSSAEDLGTTPTQRRLGGLSARAVPIARQGLSRATSSASNASSSSVSARSTHDGSDSEHADDALRTLDASQATPRANIEASVDVKKKQRSSRFPLRLGGNSSSRNSSCSLASGDGEAGRSSSAASNGSLDSRRGTPEASPPASAMGDREGNLDTSISALSIDSAAGPAPASNGSRFWRSQSASGQSTNGSTARSSSGFRLPSVARPVFGRTQSPGGAASSSLASASNTSLHSMSHAHAAHSTNGVPTLASTTTTTTTGSMAAQDEIRAATELEIQEIERVQDAVLFFAKVLEWAAWSSGSEYKCRLDNE